MKRMQGICAGALVLGVLLASLPAVAQEKAQPLTWLVNVSVKPGKWMEFEKMAEKFNKPVLEKLLAQGVIASYGLAYQTVGPPKQSYMYWVTAADWAAMAKVEKAFEENRKGMKEAEMKELIGGYLANTDADQESSAVVRHVVFAAAPGSKPRYLVRHAYKVKPEHAGAATKMFTEFNAPVYDSLLAAGTIGGYGMVVQEMHTDPSWTHTGWTTIADLSHLDAIDQAFEKADAARGEVAGAAVHSNWLRMHDSDAHWDSIMRVVMYGGR